MALCRGKFLLLSYKSCASLLLLAYQSVEQMHSLGNAPNSRFFQNKSILSKRQTTEAFFQHLGCMDSVLARAVFNPIPAYLGIGEVTGSLDSLLLPPYAGQLGSFDQDSWEKAMPQCPMVPQQWSQ